MIYNKAKMYQMSIFNAFQSLSPRVRTYIASSWVLPFAMFVFPLINPDLFNGIYSAEPSRPACPPQYIVAQFLIQSRFKFTDDQMHEQMLCNDAVRFATHTLNCSDSELFTSDNLLSDFREKCRVYAEQHDGKNPLFVCYEQLSFGLAALMGIDGDLVRIDSTQVFANIARLNRTELLYLNNQKMLAHLRDIVHKDDQDFMKKLEEHKLLHYGEASDNNAVLYHAHTTIEEKEKLLLSEADTILSFCSQEDKDSDAGKVFLRVLSEQTVVENGKRRMAHKDDKTMLSTCVQNLSDLDATFRIKAGKTFIGYVLNLVEAVGPKGSIVLAWDFEQNIANDAEMAKSFLEQSDEILKAIKMYSDCLGIEYPADMEKCQKAIQEKMAIVKNAFPRKDKTAETAVPESAEPEVHYEQETMDLKNLVDGCVLQIPEDVFTRVANESMNGVPAQTASDSDTHDDGLGNTAPSENAEHPESDDEGPKVPQGVQQTEDSASANPADQSAATSDKREPFLVNGKPVEEAVQDPEFANLDPEIRRQAILKLIQQKLPPEFTQLKGPTAVADGAYSIESLREAAAEAGFYLLPTDLLGKDSKPIIGLFMLDDSGKPKMCPAGHPIDPDNVVLYKNGSVRIQMQKSAGCATCPLRNECCAKFQKRKQNYAFTLSPNSRGRIILEAMIGTEQYKSVGRFRNGVETVPSYFHRVLDIDFLPIGMECKEVFVAGKVAAFNVWKFFLYLVGKSKIADNPIFRGSMV